MINVEMNNKGKMVTISGELPVVMAETEELLRALRQKLTEVLGLEITFEFLATIVEASLLDDEERDEQTEKELAEMPEKTREKFEEWLKNYFGEKDGE